MPFDDWILASMDEVRVPRGSGLSSSSLPMTLSLLAEFLMLVNFLPKPLLDMNAPAPLTLLNDVILLAISSFYSRLSETICVIGNASKSILFYLATKEPILRLMRIVRPLSKSLSREPLTNMARWLLNACKFFLTVCWSWLRHSLTNRLKSSFLTSMPEPADVSGGPFPGS